MGIRGDYYNKSWTNWFALVFDHIIPIIVLTLEWTHNSFVIEWNRFPLYIALGYLYIVMLMIATYVVQNET